MRTRRYITYEIRFLAGDWIQVPQSPTSGPSPNLAFLSVGELLDLTMRVALAANCSGDFHRNINSVHYSESKKFPNCGIGKYQHSRTVKRAKAEACQGISRHLGNWCRVNESSAQAYQT